MIVTNGFHTAELSTTLVAVRRRDLKYGMIGREQPKRGNYNAKDQQRYWTKEFPSQRQNRTTLASIYSDAKQNGWRELPDAPADPLPVHPISKLEHRFWVGPDETPLDIADRAVSNLREKFRQRGHHPSESPGGSSSNCESD